MLTLEFIGEIVPYAGSPIPKNGKGCAVAGYVEKKKGKNRRWWQLPAGI
ncbi:hypothetical protein GLW04_17455 [Halobacillus litoralis]|uniref:Uncharacterized protein n=1 Tax=Halobacillus litoralis TaxID=45668 RepID=A0A845DX74_9BACI|nr:hypothetical protein [Halobacillus litoralis]